MPTSSSAAARDHTVARNLGSLFDAQQLTGADPHVVPQPPSPQQPAAYHSTAASRNDYSGDAPARRYPSPPPTSSVLRPVPSTVDGRAIVTPRDYMPAGAKPNQPLASTMVERMEALRLQLLRVSSTLSGVQERAASLSATLGRSHKSLLSDGGAPLAPALAPTPSTQPRGEAAAVGGAGGSLYGNTARPMAAAAAAAAAGGMAAAADSEALVFTVMVTEVKPPPSSSSPPLPPPHVTVAPPIPAWAEGEQFGVLARC